MDRKSWPGGHAGPLRVGEMEVELVQLSMRRRPSMRTRGGAPDTCRLFPGLPSQASQSPWWSPEALLHEVLPEYNATITLSWQLPSCDGTWTKARSVPYRHSDPCCLIAHSCPTLCDPMDCSTPGFLVLRHLLELAQTHVH